MYKIGERVKFLNAVGGGVITRIVGKNVVHVENEDGFEIPVLISEIILDSSQGSDITQFVNQGKQAPVPDKKQDVAAKNDSVFIASESTVIQGNNRPDFYLAFVPENSHNPLEGQTDIYLINNSNYSLLYSYSHLIESEYHSQGTGLLEANTKLMLGSITSADINSLPEYSFQLLPFKSKLSKLKRLITKTVQINPVKFYRTGSFEKNSFFKGKAMIFKLNESELDKAVKELTDKEFKQAVSEKDKPKPQVIKEKKPEIIEVDLHIHELLDSTNGLSNKEMLDYQMKKFREEMDKAIASYEVKKIIFIHGHGNGVLKQELRKELSSKYKKYYFQDASFQEYGFGATMVVLRS